MNTFLSYKFHLLFFFLALLLLTKFAFDPDLGWHLAMGRDFLASGKFVVSDTYSWTMAGFSWQYPTFIYQIFVFFLVTTLGFWATAIIFGLMGAIFVVTLLPRKLGLGQFLLCLMGLALIVTPLGVRPHVFDVLFFGLLLRILWGGYYKKKYGWIFCFGLFATWVNLHPGIWIGLAFLVGFFVIRILQKEESWRLFGVFFLSAFLGTLLTPESLLVWWSGIGGHLSLRGWFEIAEYSPIIFFLPLNLFFAFSGFVLILWFKKKSLPFEWLALSAGLFVFTFLCSCLIVIWATLFIFLAARCNFEKVSGKIVNSALGNLGFKLILVLCVVSLLLNFVVRLIETADFEKLLESQEYPVAAMKYMEAHNLGQRVFNRYGWGGYLDWQYPNRKVFIDGRMAGWVTPQGVSIFDDYMGLAKGENCGLVTRYRIEVVLDKADEKLYCFDDFKEVYRDKVARVLVK